MIPNIHLLIKTAQLVIIMFDICPRDIYASSFSRKISTIALKLSELLHFNFVKMKKLLFAAFFNQIFCCANFYKENDSLGNQATFIPGQRSELDSLLTNGFKFQNSSAIRSYLKSHDHRISMSDFTWSGRQKEEFDCRSNLMKKMKICPGYSTSNISDETIAQMDKSSMLHCSLMRKYKYLWMPIGSYIDLHHSIKLSQERGYNFFQEIFHFIRIFEDV